MGMGGVSDLVGDGGSLFRNDDGSGVSGEPGCDSGRGILVGNVADTDAGG